MPSFMLCLAKRNPEIKIIAIKSTIGVLSEFDAPTKIAVVICKDQLCSIG